MCFTDLQKFWTGAIQSPDNVSEWYWLTGELIESHNGGQFWVNTRPTGDVGLGCATLKYRNKTGEYGLYDTSCDEIRSYFCIKDLF